MNKKPGLLLTVSLFAIIILMVAFNIDFSGVMQNFNVHINSGHGVSLPNGVNPDSVLYVCPTASSTWDPFANGMMLGRKFLTMFFVFAIIVLSFSWAWALYQNLVKDKFSADAYKNPWTLTKAFFWAMVICTVIALTPNHFRKVYVHSRGRVSEHVLCESFSTGARPVRAQSVGLK